MSRLKPCPFCGAKEPIVHIYQRSMDKQVVCDLGKGGCGACVGWYVNKQELLNAWNQRVKRVRYEK